MTKKEKQPRDANGKFAKSPCIALHGNNGSTAFFTSVKELEKFKENVIFIEPSKTPQKNPDCEPATKGYVKCLMRKTREHTHNCQWDGSPTFLLMFAGWFGSVILGASCISIDKGMQNIGNQYFVPVVLFTILITCLFYEFMKLEIVEINRSLPSDLKRYTPPTCEKKDECE
jgi:TM2 domain-containing membrane protein YozV